MRGIISLNTLPKTCIIYICFMMFYINVILCLSPSFLIKEKEEKKNDSKIFVIHHFTWIVVTLTKTKRLKAKNFINRKSMKIWLPSICVAINCETLFCKKVVLIKILYILFTLTCGCRARQKFGLVAKSIYEKRTFFGSNLVWRIHLILI